MDTKPNEIAQALADPMAVLAKLIEVSADKCAKHDRSAKVKLDLSLKFDKDNANRLLLEAKTNVTTPDGTRTDKTTKGETMFLMSWLVNEETGQAKIELS